MERSAAKPICCVGEALIDLIATEAADWAGIDQFVPRIGGAPANISVAIQRLGGSSTFLGCLASDAPGEWIRKRLQSEGVDLSSATTLDNAQTRLAIVTGPVGQRDFVFYGSPAVDSLLNVGHVGQVDFTNMSAVSAGSLLLLTEPGRSAMFRLLELVTEHNVPLVFDPNPRPGSWPDELFAREMLLPFIRQASILKLAVEEPQLLGMTVDEIRAVQPDGAVFVLTDGANGCWYWYGEQESRAVSSISVDSIDSTGAGDAFTAALTHRYVAGNGQLTLDDIRYASIAGALTTTRHGAMDALPRNDVIDALMSTWTDDSERTAGKQ